MRPGFYNDNLNRSYPFINGSTLNLPNCAVVDFGCTTRENSGFITGSHSIYLHTLTRSGNTFTFTFKSNAPGLAGKVLQFTRQTTDNEYVTSYTSEVDESVVSSSSSSSSSLFVCDSDNLWEGYLVSGDMEELSTLVSDGATINGPIPIEPARNQNKQNSYVRSVNVYNSERTRAKSTDICRDYCYDFTLNDHYLVANCITGMPVFANGYNIETRINKNDNEIEFNASTGSGLGEPCSEVKLFDEEAPAQGLSLLTGGPACDEVVKSINGVGARYLNLIAGTGVSITSIPEEHRVIVDVDLNDLALCADLGSYSSTTVNLEDNVDPCDCGPK